MLQILVRLLKNEDGFTATECGLLAALTVIAMEKLLLKF
jgi:Flp pilus assembly pilin Flp